MCLYCIYGVSNTKIQPIRAEWTSLPDEVDVLQTLRVVGGSAPVPPGPALEPGQAGVAGTAQVGDERAGDGGQGARGAGRPAQDAVVVPPAPT